MPLGIITQPESIYAVIKQKFGTTSGWEGVHICMSEKGVYDFIYKQKDHDIYEYQWVKFKNEGI